MVKYIVIRERPVKRGEEVFFDAYSLKQYLLSLGMDFVSMFMEGVATRVDSESIDKAIKKLKHFKTTFSLYDVNHKYRYLVFIKDDKDKKETKKKDKGKGKAKATKKKNPSDLTQSQITNLLYRMHKDGFLSEEDMKDIFNSYGEEHDMIVNDFVTPYMHYYRFEGDQVHYVGPSYEGGPRSSYTPSGPSYTRNPSDIFEGVTQEEMDRDELEDEEEYYGPEEEYDEEEEFLGTRPNLQQIMPDELDDMLNEADRLVQQGNTQNPLVRAMMRAERELRRIMPPTDPTDPARRRTVNIEMPQFKSKL